MARIVLDAVPLRTLRDALIGRAIRNSYHQFMTGDPHRLSIPHQVRWWYGTYKPANARGDKYGFLFYHHYQAVGYGGVSREDGKWWVTAGLVPRWRGLGLGAAMFRYVTAFARASGDGNVWLKVYSWNVPARRLYERLGYSYVGEVGEDEGNILVMVRAA